ncbi:uncharacterized protein LOC128852413 isoform X2 [Cuculus canorus]|uniref:uncharacterized protein LOC128852413 isoform X2 n=1 Tax=Cuculus canorus TaxID=55661 RepID=UPI0023AA39FA|nr:uncharacterized protein LOC128852413 isoform X2 [Cuculus canorus]
MASAEKRQRWRKRIRQPMEVAAQEMKDSVKSSEYTEGQAHKYMQKCTAESSTESESESSMEIVPRLLAGGLGKARDSKGLQFLDPYDGDSEDSSVPSDCSLNSLHGTEVAPWLNGALEATALEDDATSEDREPFPEPPDWFCPEARVSEIQAVSDCKAPLQLPSQEKNFPRALLQSSERTRATEAFTSLGLTPDRSLPVGIKPSSCCRSMTKRSLLKRKQETSISEGTSEEERRKKFSVA